VRALWSSVKNNLVEMSYGLTGHNARYGQVKNRTPEIAFGRLIERAPPIRGRRDRARFLGRRYGRVDPGACIARWCGRVQANHRTLAAQRRCTDLPHSRHDMGAFARSVEDCILVDRS